MDVLNEQQLASVVVNPALDRLKTEIIPAIQAAARAELDHAMLQASNIISAALQGAQATEDKAAHDVVAILAGFDGWTATITIPPITIRLGAPKGAA
jgi:hypothetical protein